jgi:hypothetical protein
VWQKWALTLTTLKPEVFDAPLTDWLFIHDTGPEEAARLIETGPLGVAEVELRGPALFDEVMRDALPRHILTGWGEHTAIPVIHLAGDIEYEKINVNKAWSTIRGPNIDKYLGPAEIFEGRALVMNLLYIWHLLGGHHPATTATDSTRDAGGNAAASGSGGSATAEPLNPLAVMATYLDTFYADAAKKYLSALEIISGTSAKDLFATNDPDQVYEALTSTVIAGWYALHSPPPIEVDDVLQSLTFRFVAAARVTSTNDWTRVVGGALGLMDGIDEYAKEVGSKPAPVLLRQSAAVVAKTREMASSCADEEIRGWFDRVLHAIEVTAERRAPHGYASSWGLADSGNMLSEIDDALDAGIGQLEDAPARMREWYDLRNLVLNKQGFRAEKIARLTAWFSSDVDA